MLHTRIIPCLLIRGRGLVKTVGFKKPSYVGDPRNAVKIFNEKEVDELLLVDIEATRTGNGPNFSLVQEIVAEAFMPVGYGGGIQTVDDAKKLFSIGVEKVCVQTAAIGSLELVTKLAKQFGSQSVVVSIDLKKNLFGKSKLYSSASRKIHKKPWEEFLVEAVNAGAGEVLLNSVDRDGKMSGYDLVEISKASEICDVPLIALGGARCLDDFVKAVKVGASAVSAGSMFVYQGPHKAVLISYPPYGQLEELLGEN
ncbi:AglZ/HisF2 family acetamidino modification protein [Endozoicomonas numazuensis]|uniref:imidazole glycerol-phosphate synthase n=1 Tax=Endozoicomonas numazuensis TaxID=1137799 RepID=A0A081N3R6_9GAMM|nr:AglZ/HisF2 family acetamidino modification protein [Endozoicomonas numazuensis]KEQ13089.1 imidazole glycerol phosphate synthase [Endozoicomonas numazuensis]